MAFTFWRHIGLPIALCAAACSTVVIDTRDGTGGAGAGTGSGATGTGATGAGASGAGTGTTTGTTTGTGGVGAGTTSSTAGTGGVGAGTTSSTGGTTTTSTGTGTGPVCDLSGFCGSCTQCAWDGPCGSYAQACLANPACYAIIDCYQTCPDGDQVCYDACWFDHQDGQIDYNAVAICIYCDECFVDCDSASLGCPG